MPVFHIKHNSTHPRSRLAPGQAGNLGYTALLVSDATATFKVRPDGKKYPADTMHDTTLASLHQEFATATDTETLLNTLHS